MKRVLAALVIAAVPTAASAACPADLVDCVNDLEKRVQVLENEVLALRKSQPVDARILDMLQAQLASNAQIQSILQAQISFQAQLDALRK